MPLIDDIILTLKNYSSDLELASNYGEFAELPKMVIEKEREIDRILEQLHDMVSNNVQSVIEFKYAHRKTWRDKSNSFWLAGLIEEVTELIGVMIGIHKHELSFELKQIASICMNWLDKITQEKERAEQ